MSLLSWESSDEEAAKQADYAAKKEEDFAVKYKNLLSEDRQFQKDQDFLQAIGEAPLPDAQPSLLNRFLDFVSTPGHLVRGGLSYMLGQDGYNQDFASALSKATSDNLTTADMMRKEGVTNPIVLGVGGFIGDVLTDPVSYVSGPQGVKFGGARISDEAIQTAKGLENAAAIKNRIFEAASKAKFAELTKGKEFDELTTKSLQAIADAHGTQVAHDAFANAKAFLRNVDDPVLQRVSEMASDYEVESLTARSSAADSARLLITPNQSYLDAAREAGQRSAKIREAIIDTNPETGLRNSLHREGVEKGLFGGAADAEDIINADSPDELRKLFKPATIKFTSPFIGLPGVEQSKLPWISERERDIPIVSDAVEKLGKIISQGYYATPLKVANFLEKGLAEAAQAELKAGIPAGQSLTYKTYDALQKGSQLAARGHEALVKGASYVSRRVQAVGSIFGSADRRNLIQQHERARALLGAQEFAHASAMSEGLDALPNANEIFKDIGTSLDDGISQFYKAHGASPRAMFSALTHDAERIPPDVIRQNVLADAQQAIVNKYGPEIGPRAAKYMGYVWDEFQRLGQLDKKRGLINNVETLYLHQMYDNTDDALRTAADPGAAKKYKTIALAQANLLKPDPNIRNMLAARRYASARAYAEKDFAARMAYQHGVRKEYYDALVQIARDEKAANHLEAVQALKSLGVLNAKDITPLAYVGDLNPERIIDADKFDNLKNIFTHYGPEDTVYKDAHAQIKSMLADYPDMTGAPAEPSWFFNGEGWEQRRERIAGLADTFRKGIATDPTALGESAFARSGATTIAPYLKERLLKNTPESERYIWDSLIPQSLHEAIDESYHTYDLLKKNVELDAIKNPKNPILKMMNTTLNFMGKFNTIAKRGAITLWPSYYTRNMYSAGFQMGAEAAPFEQIGAAARGMAKLGRETLGLPAHITGNDAYDLGKFLNVFDVFQNHKLMDSKGVLIAQNGAKYTSAEIQQALLRAGIPWNNQHTVDLLATYGDMLEQMTREPSLLGAMPELKKFVKAGDRASFVNSKALEAAKATVPLTDRFWKETADFGARLEKYASSHTMISLVKRGWDLDSAAQEAIRLHVDYANGKTAFERNVLNKLFFFYSFSRGNATNVFVNMMRKPSTLTTQLHAINAAGELLKDPNTYVEDPDLEQAVRSTRLNEQIAAYIGKNKAGIPQFLASTGLPLEDLTKYFNIQTPSEIRTSELIRAGVGTASRTSKLLMSQTNPLIKNAIEMLSGRSLFFDRPITDASLRKFPKWDADMGTIAHYPFRAVPKEVWHGLDAVTKEVLDAKDNGDGTFTVNPYMLSILTTITPMIGAATNVPYLSAAARGASFLPRSITTRNYMIDPHTSDLNKYLRGLTGLNVMEVDPEISTTYDKAQRMQERMDALGIPKSQRLRQRMLAAETDQEED